MHGYGDISARSPRLRREYDRTTIALTADVPPKCSLERHEATSRLQSLRFGNFSF